MVGDPTPVETFTTLAPRVYNCGESDLPFLPSTYTPLENALVGTQVKIGQFMMTMTQVNALGAAGHYAGKGEIPIAFLMGAKAKVTFSDIFIDSEYRVRTGRVDVITEGLANWLDDQMMQFIDPYYVDGTIDSAWVDTTAGVAWVVVDGVPQDFVFDPPNYPIIVNDASGNQYTIYPNGLIVVGTYLSVSETWQVAANETVRFGQNDSEERGFDPKEHQEWHENYETMKLSDNTFYYVANKSLAKSEGDMVNVQFPANVTHVRFQLPNGDTIPYVDLEGSWMGTKPYLDSGLVKTLYLPSFSSSGKYEVSVFVDGVKSGQLNIQVYGEKTKDVVVVPIASISSLNIDATVIENELKRTLGEANITIDVTLEDPWTDSTGTFTATTNISLPTEVGLLTKYSDDMRDLRDAYFEQHPNASKSKYYVFLVNGFDDPSQLGYMVRGRSMGFVKASSSTTQVQVLQTISHELGHGMGALEHTFKNEVIAQGSTNNLMDYSGETNLTIAQWKELRDLDLAPSLFDEVEDAQNAVVSVNAYDFPDYLKNNGAITFITPAGKPITIDGEISELVFQTISYNPTTNYLESHQRPPFGSLIGFTRNAVKYALEMGDNNMFLGYSRVNDTIPSNPYYTESLSATNCVGLPACVAIPIFNDGNFGLGISKCDFLIASTTPLMNKGDGSVEEYQFLMNNYCENLNVETTHILEAIVDYRDYTQEILLLDDLMDIVNTNLSIPSATSTNFSSGHYFGISAYLTYRLLHQISSASNMVPCLESIKSRLNDKFNGYIGTEAKRLAIINHYSDPTARQFNDTNFEYEFDAAPNQVFEFTQNVPSAIEMRQIQNQQTVSNWESHLLTLSSSSDITMWKKNLILNWFFTELETLIEPDGAVNMSFIEQLRGRLYTNINNNATISSENSTQLSCLFGGLEFDQRKQIIDALYNDMAGSFRFNAPRTEIVLRLFDTAPADQYAQLRTLLTANNYTYYNEFCNAFYDGRFYNFGASSGSINASNFASFSGKQIKRAVRIVGMLSFHKNQSVVSEFNSSSSTYFNGAQVVPLFRMDFLDPGSSVSSSYSSSSKEYTVDVYDVVDPTDLFDNQSFSRTLDPFDLVLASARDDFDPTVVTKLNGDPIEEGDEFLIPSANLHLLLADQENYIYNKYIKYCITAGLLVASGGSSSWLIALEAGVIGTQMFLEHNEMNLNTMEDGDLKTSLIALKDYGDFIIVGAALSKYAFTTGTRVPFISRTTNSGVVKHTIHNDEIGLVLKELRNKNQLSENLIRLKTLVNSFDNISDYKVKAVQKYLKAFEKDATFQQLSGNLTEHYVHFEALSGKPHFMYVPWGSGATIKAPHMFDVNFTNNQLELTNIDWLPDNTNGIIQSVAKYSNVKYTKKNGQLVSSGNIEVVRNSSQQFYMRIPPFDVFIARLNQLGLTDLHDKIIALSSTDKTKFFNGFSQAPDPLLTRMNQNDFIVDIWAGHTVQGQNLLASNTDVWLKHIEARELLKNGQYAQVGQLFGKTVNDGTVIQGYKYVMDGVYDVQAIQDAINIANSTSDVALIAQNTGISQNIIQEVKEHFFVKEHLVATDQGFKIGRFERTPEDIALWNAAMNNFQGPVTWTEIGFQMSMTPLEATDLFNKLILHEYVELKLMELGIGYRGMNQFDYISPSNFGAHDIAPNMNSGLSLIPESNQSVTVNISNLQIVINQITEFLKL